MPLQPLNTTAGGRNPSLLSPSDYDADAVSIRSDQDTDSDDDERQLRARNSRELRAHDRLVLMEEEELDHLVTETRKQKQGQRRGSGLPIPNPLRLLTRRLSDASLSRSRSPSVHPGESVEDLGVEKRRARRQRRKTKRDRLLADAHHGEDGELMYEMEEGGMKDGSSTGDSSDRDDSDEVDRKHLLHITEAKMKRKRSCRRWLLLYAIIGVAFAILALLAWKLSLERKSARPSQKLVSNGTALFAPTTIIISLDGFRADFLDRRLTPRLTALVKDGVSPLYMLPSFPSVTFPNHYTIATGLYPESHGIVGNNFWDPALEEDFSYTEASLSMDQKWWGGEPFWVTAQNQGLKTAIHMWPGSEAHILDMDPTYLDKYNGKEMLNRKVDRVLEWLDMPDADRPQLIAAYVPNIDSDGHRYGPNSTEIQFTIQKVDKMLDNMFKGLEERNLTDLVNVIVVSDHGMATTDISRVVQLEDLVDLDKIAHTDGWPLIGLRPKNDDDLLDIHQSIVEKTRGNPNLNVYLRDVDMPKRYHFSKSERIAPLWIVPKAGWAVVTMDVMNVNESRARGDVYRPRGLHGYDHHHPLMRAIFIARGPAFPHQPNSKIDVFQNVEVYNLLCDSVGITPALNNGTLRLPLKPVGFHDDPSASELDPPSNAVETYPAPSSPTSEPTKAILVNPISTTSGLEAAPPPTITVGVDQPEAQPQPTQPPSGADDSNGDGDESSAVDKVESSVKDFWDWFTGKVNNWWGKVTGHSDGESGAGEDGGSPE
ncbi:Phosphodiest-domain-containing protein [Parathielavia hyrcaniae]|uniref:Phosphodiest-domain-containing protein n=1 Tax=Parathielavia hyrcaniae TaxID=113614 RepID=A0AAN6T3Q0_9PEZI|nr:Phosphodiest-domain-containing protein [Parathielavia hyrcaniae]